MSKLPRLRLRVPLAALALAVPAAGALAASRYDESVNGDLSNDGLAPTPLSFSAGANAVVGTTGRDASGIDRDYATFTIQPGQQLTGIDVLPGTSAIGAVSFIGLQAGSQLTVSPAAATADGLLGWWHYSAADVGTSILPAMAVANNGSSGFQAPLGAGTYALWIQDFGTGTVGYGFQFDVSAVPEPGSLALFALGFGLIVPVWRARRGIG